MLSEYDFNECECREPSSPQDYGYSDETWDDFYQEMDSDHGACEF